MSLNPKLVCATFLLSSLSAFSVLQANEAHADSPAAGPGCDLASENGGYVQILLGQQHGFEPALPTFVITHGMGGTQPNDRFHQLAIVIQDTLPQCNVLLVDWSRDATKSTSFPGIPSPWEVAKKIEPVARQVSEELQTLSIDPTQTTFIGESFGNCVNARIAEHLGRRGRILAFNPPNSAGGYKIPDLRTCADLTWSFQTFSVFDTQTPIAHMGFFLETHANATDLQKHIAGVSWLADQVRFGNTKWLLMQHQMENARDNEFDAIAAISGELINNQHPPRERSPEFRANSRTSVTLVTTAL